MADLANYIVHLPSDRDAMLTSMGLGSIDDLFTAIPKDLRFSRALDVPAAMSEWALDAHLRALADRNATTRTHLSFLGGGMYDHHVPAVVDAIASRGEFLTAYTPYQPEMSQGLLQALAEYQQAIGAITGLPVVNSSSYDGATALADAAWVGRQALAMKAGSGATPVVIAAATLWPQHREVLGTYMYGRGVDLADLPCEAESGRVDLAALERLLAASSPAVVLVQSPNRFGVIEHVAKISEVCRRHGAITAVSWNPLLSGLLQVPGEQGADIVCGEGQPLGIPLCAGGPTLGFLACRKDLRRHMPGRLVGKVADIYGNPAYALVHEDREQHVAREKATSNICSNQALCSVRAAIYLSLLGDTGLRRLARIIAAKTQFLADALTRIPGVRRACGAPVFNEFLVTVPRSTETLARLLDGGILGGLDGATLGRPGTILVAVTETKTRAELERMAAAFAKAVA